MYRYWMAVRWMNNLPSIQLAIIKNSTFTNRTHCYWKNSKHSGKALWHLIHQCVGTIENLLIVQWGPLYIAVKPTRVCMWENIRCLMKNNHSDRNTIFSPLMTEISLKIHSNYRTTSHSFHPLSPHRSVLYFSNQPQLPTLAWKPE